MKNILSKSKHIKYKIFFLIILFSGIGLRLYHVWTAPFAYVHCDTCNIWLMAKHILQGEFPLFFYKQYYLGPLEAISIAFFWIIFGIKSSTLYLGTILSSGLFSISSYFLGKELSEKYYTRSKAGEKTSFSERSVTIGLLTMLYATFPPAYFFWASIIPFGYWVEIPLLGNMLFLFALKTCGKDSGINKTVLYMLIGACAGIGLWTHYIMAYYFIPTILYLVINVKWKILIKNSIPALLAFFVSALPFWIFTFRYNFASFKFQPRTEATDGSILLFLKTFFSHICYMFNINISHNNLLNILGIIILIIYIVYTIWFIMSTTINRSVKFIFSKKSIFVYLFVSILIFYVLYRSRISVGEGYNYLIPIITFASIVFGYCSGFLLKKSRIAGFVIVFFVISFNMWSIVNRILEDRAVSLEKKQEVFEKIKFMNEKHICCYVGHERDSFIPAFFSNEKIIGTDYAESSYYPYADRIDACTRIAFEVNENSWQPILDNICASYNYDKGLYYGFKPHLYIMKLINANKWHGYSNINTKDARYAFDRNYDNYWSSKRGKKHGMSFMIDLGKEYTVCKIEILNHYDYLYYPDSCKIQTSIDKKEWRNSAYVKSTQPLFWSGPRPYWRLMDGRMEWFLKPVKARYIRLVHMSDNIHNAWIMNEVFIYEYKGIERKRVKDFVKDAHEITRFCTRHGIDFVYADYWLSAEIKKMSKNKIETLVPYNPCLPIRENMSRDVVLSDKKAFIVREGDTEEIERILTEFDMLFKKCRFKNYALYYVPDLNKEYEKLYSLAWTEIGLVKHSLKKYSAWLYGIGKYEKALQYYPNNYAAYLKCGAPLSKNNNAASYYAKASKDESADALVADKSFFDKRFFPQVQSDVSFINGIKFLGYSIDAVEIRPGKTINIEYYWETEKEPEDSLFVFVYFIKDGKIVFQQDHGFLYQFSRPLMPLENERFRETLKLVVPKDIEPGNYEIVIGLWNAINQKRIKIKDPSKNNISKQIIGELVVG